MMCDGASPFGEAPSVCDSPSRGSHGVSDLTAESSTRFSETFRLVFSRHHSAHQPRNGSGLACRLLLGSAS
eukprot:8467560-Pyramimonas_sp.AAC.1